MLLNQSYHIFYIHNNLSIVMLNAILSHYSIKRSNVFLMIDKRMRNETDNLRGFKILNFLDWNGKFNWINLIKISLLIDKNLKDELKNTPFVLYIPHTKRFLFSLIASSSMCEGYYVYEEGLAAYVGRESGSVKYLSLKKALFPRLFGFEGDFYHEGNKFLGYLSLHKMSFSWSNKTNTVLEPIKMVPSYLFNDDLSHILIFDALLEFEMVNKNRYFEGLLLMKTYFKNLDIRHLYIKYHPSQTNKNIALINSIFAECGMTIITIPNNVVLEDFIFDKVNRNMCVFYGFMSTLLFYAALKKFKVISFSELMLDDGADPFKEYIKEIELSVIFISSDDLVD